MSGGPRHAPGGIVCPVRKRGVARLPLLEKAAAYDAFLRVVTDDPFYAVCHYVERNPCAPSGCQAPQTGVGRACGGGTGRTSGGVCAAWPLAVPCGGVEPVKAAQTAADLEALRCSVQQRGGPLGALAWPQRLAARLGLGHT